MVNPIHAILAGAAGAWLLAWLLSLAPLPQRLPMVQLRVTGRERAARRPARAARETIDRAALVSALRNLGHRADEARRMAAAVPAGVTDIGDAINFLYRRG